ncbi:MAG: hypothetical protein ACOYLI_12465 [Synechococcus lacustris]
MVVIEHHHRCRFVLFAYSSRYLKDGMTTQIAKRLEHWRDRHQLDDAALADVIRADGIDLLIDLTMYPRDCRRGLRAELQSSPGSSGLKRLALAICGIYSHHPMPVVCQLTAKTEPPPAPSPAAAPYLLSSPGSDG